MKTTSLLSSLFVATGLVMTTSAFSMASAASLNFNIEQFTGDNTRVNFLLDEVAPDTVRFQVSVLTSDGNFSGDLVGLFFNVSDSFAVASSGFSANLVDVTPNAGTANQLPSTFFLDKSGSTSDNITAVDNNVNLNGGGVSRNFDFGVQLGKGGASDRGAADFFTSATFDISAAGLKLEHFLGQSFGARLQSTSGPQGSSKLDGSAPASVVDPTIPPVVQPPIDNPGEIPTDPEPTPEPKSESPKPVSVPEPGTIAGLALLGGLLTLIRDRKSVS